MLTHNAFLAAGIGSKLNPWCGVIIFPVPVELHANTTIASRVVGIGYLCHLRIGKPDMSFGNDRGIEQFVAFILSGGHHLEHQCRGDILADRAILQVSLIDDVLFNT